MANSSNESLRMQTIYGCDRCFFSSPLLSVFLQHRCRTTGESDLRFDRFRTSFPFILLIIRAGNTWLVSAYFADENRLIENYLVIRVNYTSLRSSDLQCGTVTRFFFNFRYKWYGSIRSISSERNSQFHLSKNSTGNFI